jgi:isoleucyl-tRNA synthetase
VHAAPGHGLEDFVIGQQYHQGGQSRGSDGRFYPDTLVGGHRCGTPTRPSWKPSLKGLLLAQDKIRHSYPHCWRHKTPSSFAPPGNGSSGWIHPPSGRGEARGRIDIVHVHLTQPSP